MHQDAPTVTSQEIFDEAHPYFGGGSYFQTTAYDTRIIISNREKYDVYHHFELFDRKILWINQVQQEVGGVVRTVMPRTIFPCSPDNFDGHIVAHRFSSVLCYVVSNTFINPKVWAGIAHPAASVVQPAEKYVGMLIKPNDVDSSIDRLNLDTFTEKKWAALAHYRQSAIAETPYYQVLSYWKILELYFNNVRADIDNYINNHYASRPDIYHELGTFTGTVANKLRSIRNASAHFMLLNNTTVEDPDNPDIFNKVSNALFPLRRLSEELLNKTSGW